MASITKGHGNPSNMSEIKKKEEKLKNVTYRNLGITDYNLLVKIVKPMGINMEWHLDSAKGFFGLANPVHDWRISSHLLVVCVFDVFLVFNFRI